MKRILFLILGCTLMAGAQEAAKDAPLDEAALAERREKMQQLRAEMLRKNGPMVTSAITGPAIVYFDMQSAVPHDVVTNMVENVGKATRLPFKAVRAEAPATLEPLTLTRDALAAEGVAAAVFVVDYKGWPALWMAPEENWVILNVDALRKDAADDEQFQRRAHQQLWRAACYTLGAGDSRAEKCVMSMVNKMTDLDALNIAPYPEYIGKMMQHARALGVESRRTAPYRKAVEEGWAEKPSDEIEQAIWDEVKGN